MGAIRENLRRNLSYYLSLKSISQKQLAEYLGVSQAAVTNWIKGKNAPDIETVASICDYLQIAITDLFGTGESGTLSDRERELIQSYRSKPEMQVAVDTLLGLSPK